MGIEAAGDGHGGGRLEAPFLWRTFCSAVSLMAHARTSPDKIITYAHTIDLYARRYRLIFAVDVGEFHEALELCQQAEADCQRELKEAADRAARKLHLQNLLRLKELKHQIRNLAHTPGV